MSASPEITNWLTKRQDHLKVAKTTVTPGGKTLDWVPIESQTHEKIATPPTQIPAHASAKVTVSDPKRPAKGASFDVGEPGPAGHVPILRPDTSKIKGTLGLKNFLAKRGGLLFSVNRGSKKPGDPDPAGYFHASSAQWSQILGCDAWYNVWDPQVDIPSSPGDDHSISQTWLQNHQTSELHSLEAGLTVDHSLNGDSANHIFTYYTTNGYSADGNNIGGYNRLDGGWIQYHPSIYPGIRINGSSVQGGVQLEIGLKYQLYYGNWWLGFNNVESGPWIWLGYYPANLFNGGLANMVDWVSFGGEVYSQLANPCSTTDQMGSGRQAHAGWSHAAYQRNLQNQANADGAMVAFNGVPEVDAAASNCPNNPYTIQTSMNSGSSWGSYQFFGGPSD